MEEKVEELYKMQEQTLLLLFDLVLALSDSIEEVKKSIMSEYDRIGQYLFDEK
ncbi:MAG: hypothetical protein QW764_02440 [Desulfurococcaceae archaeon]